MICFQEDVIESWAELRLNDDRSHAASANNETWREEQVLVGINDIGNIDCCNSFNRERSETRSS